MKMMERRRKGNIEISPISCPRCGSCNTKFCYYNNYSLTQPRFFCKGCRRYWTKGGSLRNVPLGGGCRKNRRLRSSVPSTNNSHSYDDPTKLASESDAAAPPPRIDVALVYASFLKDSRGKPQPHDELVMQTYTPLLFDPSLEDYSSLSNSNICTQDEEVGLTGHLNNHLYDTQLSHFNIEGNYYQTYLGGCGLFNCMQVEDRIIEQCSSQDPINLEVPLPVPGLPILPGDQEEAEAEAASHDDHMMWSYSQEMIVNHVLQAPPPVLGTQPDN